MAQPLRSVHEAPARSGSRMTTSRSPYTNIQYIFMRRLGNRRGSAEAGRLISRRRIVRGFAGESLHGVALRARAERIDQRNDAMEARRRFGGNGPFMNDRPTTAGSI